MNALIPVTNFRSTRWWQCELNPVLLKELRQAMRSQVLIAALMLLLAALFLTTAAILGKQKFLPEEDAGLGLFVFRVFLVILTAITIVFVPMYVGIRLGLERQQFALDLMFMTTLSPRCIVRGKLFCGLYLAALFFSVCTPFMTLTVLLRGMDLPTIGVVLAFLFEGVCLAVLSAIFLGSLPIANGFKILVGGLFMCGLVAAGYGLFWLCSDLMHSGVGATVGTSGFWIGFFAILLPVVAGFTVLYSGAVDLVTADNRPRGYYGVIIHRPPLDETETVEDLTETATSLTSTPNPKTV